MKAFDPSLFTAVITPWWELSLAQLFGEPFVYADRGGVLKGARWRSRVYIFEFIEA